MPPNTERDRCTAAFFAFGGGVRAMAASPLQDTALEILPDISRDIDRPLQTHSHCIMWERQPSVPQCKHFPAGNQLSFLPVNHDANTMNLTFTCTVVKLLRNQSMELRDVDDKKGLGSIRRHVGGSARRLWR